MQRGSSKVNHQNATSRRRRGQSISTLLFLAAAGIFPARDLRADDTNQRPVVRIEMLANTMDTNSPGGWFRISRDGDPTAPLVVNYQLGGTATNGMDYARLPGALTIPAGATNADLEVAPFPSATDDPWKSVTVTLVPHTQPFALVVLPDTQYYTAGLFGGRPDIFTVQTRWIVAHRDELNIVYVLHEGDVTDGNTQPEWDRAKVSVGVLDGVVPYAIAVGNHDGLMTSRNRTDLFNAAFPLSQFQGWPTYGGVFESNRMDNCYHLFSAGGIDWLVLVLEFGPRNAVLDWANQVVAAHPDRRVILLTHAHVDHDNTLMGGTPGQLWIPTAYGRENDGLDVWDKLLRIHTNSALVFNGHDLGNGTGRVVGLTDGGTPVFQMLANYQTMSFGGGGRLRLVQFYPDEDRMTVKTYSPFLDAWQTNSDQQFEYTNANLFTAADPGYQVSAVAGSATLFITNHAADLTPPTVVKTRFVGQPPLIQVSFSKPVDVASAEELSHYALDGAVRITGARLLAGGTTVALTSDTGFVTGLTYTLTVQQIRDRSRAGNELAAPSTNQLTCARVFLADSFSDGVLEGWTAVDDGTLAAPSQWLEQTDHLAQAGSIFGPAPDATDHRDGTYLYWNDSSALGWSNYIFAVNFTSAGSGSVGVFFRYQDASNYYKLELDAQRDFRKLFKKVAGIETTLASEPGGFMPDSNSVLRVDAMVNALTVRLDGNVLFGGPVIDADQPAGTVALYCWSNPAVSFDHLVVAPPHRPPSVVIQTPSRDAAIAAPGLIPINVSATDPDGQIGWVDLFCGDALLAHLTAAPFEFDWTNAPEGNCTLTARAVDDASLVATSGPLEVVVQSPRKFPRLLVAPASQTVALGDGVALRARAAGAGPMSYQWLHDGQAIDGATNAFLFRNNVQTGDAGSYTVTISNVFGAVTSAPAVLAVQTDPLPTVNGVDGPPLVFASSEVLDSGLPLISVRAPAQAVVNIEVSGDLLTWSPFLSLTNGGNVLFFTDLDAVNCATRFYRASLQPRRRRRDLA